jgi:hypothetical protein
MTVPNCDNHRQGRYYLGEQVTRYTLVIRGGNPGLWGADPVIVL